ncbi:MAG: peptidylprolyl isomerase [Candidatus Neomarinimicrobiota bacterium]
MANCINRTAIASLALVCISCTLRMGEDDVVAIDGEVFSREAFLADVGETRFSNLDVVEKREVIGEFAERVIISMEAEMRGLRNGELTMKAEMRARENLTVNKIFEEEIWTSLLSDSSLRLLYERMGREIGVQHVVLTFAGSHRSKSDRPEEHALSLIKEIREKIIQGEMKFYEAAKKYSEDPSRYNDGQLGRFKWGELFEPVQTAAFSLGAGEISMTVRSDVGYHIVRVSGIKKLPRKPYEEMIPRLRQFIRSNQGHEFDVGVRNFESILRNRYGVTFNDDMIRELLAEIIRVHRDHDGSPKVSDITLVDLPGIVFVAGGIPVELPWLQERIELLGSPLSESLVISERSLTITLEHILYRFLTNQFAEETRGEEWFVEIDKAVERKRPDILKNILIERLSKENSDASKDELIQLVTDRHRVDINEDFLALYVDPAEPTDDVQPVK